MRNGAGAVWRSAVDGVARAVAGIPLLPLLHFAGDGLAAMVDGRGTDRKRDEEKA